ncbi:MAG: glycosyltransferase [Planctomycetota bacterium]|nr:glycosyltransferase [Planctomycetota bacterium]
MKVLQFVADGSPGGGTNHVLQLLRGLTGSCQPILMTQQDSYLPREAQKLGVRVVTGDFLRSRINPSAIRLVRETICRHKPDLVHCHGGRAAFFRSLVRDRTPSVYTVHGFHFARKPPLARLAGWCGEFWTFRRMQHVIFVCDFDRKLAVRSRLLPANKSFRVVYNGIPAPCVEQPELQEKLGVGFIGRMVYQKNPQLFVEVLDRLPDVHAVMVGGGDLESEVVQLIKSRGLADRVRLYGSLGHEEALKVLSRLDVLLMTPRWEGLPLLPLEAMFLKVPVVSTSGGGIPEVIDHGRTGMLAESEDADQLASHVNELLHNDSLRTEIIENASRKAASQFGQEVMLQRVMETYASLSRAPRKSPRPSLPTKLLSLWKASGSS